MATFYKSQHLAAVLLLFFIFTTFTSPSSARLLSNSPPSTTETTLDLALADLVEVEGHKTDVVLDVSKQHPETQPQPCDHMVPMKKPHVGILKSPTQRLAGKFVPTIFSMLPKGAPIPPSAPSHGINDINN
ncbi:hypothetical protein Gohar_000157 [Gossypium harknessii]|uniref:Uncharacterized protein n=1 Tax=Gossypium harknessii TaxID=34285 RepID=A0A7J9HZX1_9ROSI|nr:hypothetical protein [Gossypium harknessii]